MVLIIIIIIIIISSSSGSSNMALRAEHWTFEVEWRGLYLKVIPLKKN